MSQKPSTFRFSVQSPTGEEEYRVSLSPEGDCIVITEHAVADGPIVRHDHHVVMEFEAARLLARALTAAADVVEKNIELEERQIKAVDKELEVPLLSPAPRTAGRWHTN